MIRKIIVPTERQYILEIPASFIGKNVEVLAFEVAEAEELQEENKKERLKKIRSAFDGVRVDLSNYKFDRDEANNYDE
jgi:hypothetical protein